MLHTKCTLDKYSRGSLKLLRACPENFQHANNQKRLKSSKPTPNFNYNNTLVYKFSKDEKPTEMHSIWLRHHCQYVRNGMKIVECEQCFNKQTNQRVKIPSDLPSISTATNSTVKPDKLLVTWNDGHQSKYDTEWLKWNVPRRRSELLSCYHHEMENLELQRLQNINSNTIFDNVSLKRLVDPIDSAILFEDFMKEGNSGVGRLLGNIIQFGYGIVIDCPADFETTKKVISKVSHPQNTIFGDFSEWTSNLAHADTAYTSDFVHLHTDTSYFTEPVGLQIFHCLKHDGTGGMNLLADGFQIAHQICLNNYEYYRQLASVSIPSQYVDCGKHNFLSYDTVVGHSRISGKIAKIRYNPHDMSVLSKLSFENVANFYESLVHFSNLLEDDPQTIKLTPGLIIFLDNWRVLHGRTAFTGFRHLCGAYISRSDWLSRARTLGILNEI